MKWFFDSGDALGRILVVGAATYVLMLVMLRLSGNRTLAKTAAFDQIVSVALGSTLATAILSKQTPLADGALGFLLLVAMQFVLAWTILRSPFVAKLVVQKPQVLVLRGEVREEALRRTRLTRSDLHAAMRKAAVGRVADVALLVLESDGGFSVVKRGEEPLDVTCGIEDQL